MHEVRALKILFIEPPKDFYFVMGEYLPPPYGIIQLATYLEKEVKNVSIEILDCKARATEASTDHGEGSYKECSLAIK